MLEGRCPKCGTYRVGWALRFPRHQVCPKCGGALEISEDGRPVAKGYSPFTAEEYIIRPPSPTKLDEIKNREQDKKRRS